MQNYYIILNLLLDYLYLVKIKSYIGAKLEG